MAKFVFGMNLFLDGYVDPHIAPGPVLFRHFIEQVRGLAGSVYGRRMYEVMRVWGRRPSRVERGVPRLRGGMAEPTKMVVSRSLTSVGPNATLVTDSLRGGDTQAEDRTRWGD